MVARKTGPLSRAELMELWRSVTDPEYHRPLFDNPDGNLAAVEQAAEQYAAVSSQIDANTQAMYILPWSGQTAPPASGGGFARTTLTLTRTAHFELPLVFMAGELLVQHRLDDYGPEGAVDVTTNRLYAVEQTVVLGVGESGPIDLDVVAVKDGPGYNQAAPGTLRTILQPGVNFNNTNATVENQPGRAHRVICTIFSDVAVPSHIGQYLLFTAGSNVGQYRRIVGIEDADPDYPHGGVFNVAAELILAVTVVVGSFTIGEQVTQAVTGATGEFLALSNSKLVLVRSSGTFSGTDPVTGEFGASATVVAKEQSETLVAEVATAGWRVVSWTEVLGVSITNEEFPTGGVCAMLDELGNERGLPRSENESDEEYRRRISVPADVVTPAAVIRAANKILEPYDESACLREVGQPLFQGAFYDGDPNQAPFAFDLDLFEMTLSGGGFIPGEPVRSVGVDGSVTTGQAQFDYVAPTTAQVFRGVVKVKGPAFAVGQTLEGDVSGASATILTVGPGLGVLPQHRFNTYLSLYEFRGFFIVGVPPLVLDDFGFFYDVGSNSAYDTNVVDNFYDGVATAKNTLYSRLWAAVNAVRPAGVPFDLYLEDVGCI